MRQVLEWRIGRRDYAICLAMYVAAFVAVRELLSATLAEIALPLIWVLTLAAPRLRDIGWNPWWSVAPFGAGVAVGILNGLIAAITGQPSPLRPGLMALLAFGSLGFMILLAFKKSRAIVAASM